jgi:hypothetical protein
MCPDECLFWVKSGHAADITAKTESEPQAVFGSIHPTCVSPYSLTSRWKRGIIPHKRRWQATSDDESS